MKNELIFEWSEDQKKQKIRSKKKGIVLFNGIKGEIYKIISGPKSTPIIFGTIHCSKNGFNAIKESSGSPSVFFDYWNTAVDYLIS